MTVGSSVLDARYSQPVTFRSFSGTFMVGPIRTRSHSGADRSTGRPKWLAVSSVARPVFDSPLREKGESVRAWRRRVRNEKKNFVANLSVWRSNRKIIASARRRYKLSMAPHPYLMSATTRVVDVYGYYNIGTPSDIYVRNEPEVREPVPLEPEAYYRLIDKLGNKITGSGFHPAITAAEMPKTLRTIGNAARQLSLGMLALKQGNLRGVFRQFGKPHVGNPYGKTRDGTLTWREGADNLASFWLAFRYGWRPLLKDLEDASAYLAEVLHGGQASSGRIACGDVFRRELNDRSWNGLWEYKHIVSTWKVRYVVTDLKFDPIYVPNPYTGASLAWELLPFSFVYDWVIPIGSYLQALRTAASFTGTVCLSEKVESTFSRPHHNMWWMSDPLPLVGIGDQSATLTTLRRTVSDKLFVPAPAGGSPPRRQANTWLNRAIDSISLLRNGLDLKLPVPNPPGSTRRR